MRQETLKLIAILTMAGSLIIAGMMCYKVGSKSIEKFNTRLDIVYNW